MYCATLYILIIHIFGSGFSLLVAVDDKVWKYALHFCELFYK